MNVTTIQKRIQVLKYIVEILMMIAILFVSITVYAYYIEPKVIINRHVQLAFNEESTTRLKVIQLTDLHIGEAFSLHQLQLVVDKVNKQSPDIVVFTGDLYAEDIKLEDVENIGAILAQIEAVYGKFAVWGNRDYSSPYKAYYEQILEEADFSLLANDNKIIDIEGQGAIQIIGLDDALHKKDDIEKAYDREIQTLWNMLLVHEPDIVDDIDIEGIDLILAGHSHGGQVRIPFVGPIETNRMAEKYIKGLYELEKNQYLYVSSGLGTSREPVRLFNLPEIVVFEITF